MNIPGGAIAIPSSLATTVVVAAGMYVFCLLQGILQQRLYERVPDQEQFVFTSTLLLATTTVSSLLAGSSLLLQTLDFSRLSNWLRCYLLSFTAGRRWLGRRNAHEVRSFVKVVSRHELSPEWTENQLAPIGTSKCLPLPSVSPRSSFLTGCHWDVCLCAITLVISKSLGWHALTLVDYPTQALCKCAKPVAILVLSLFLRTGRRYGISDCVTVVWIVASLFVFNVARPFSTGLSPTHSVLGNMLLLGSLMCDGLTGGRQDKLAVNHGLNNLQMMGSINAAAAILIFPVAAVLELNSFIVYAQYRREVLALVFLFSISCACGQVFMYSAISRMGALHTSVITTSRKFFMVIFSVLLFGKKLVPLQWCSLASMFFALGFRVYISNVYPSKTAHQADLHKLFDSKSVELQLPGNVRNPQKLERSELATGGFRTPSFNAFQQREDVSLKRSLNDHSVEGFAINRHSAPILPSHSINECLRPLPPFVL